jgi:hypothetical protein
MDLSQPEIIKRLEVLYNALDQFPAGVACPWPLARIFNELLKQARRELPEDPVIKGIRYFEEASADPEPGGSNAASGTVRALIDQITVALDDRPAQAAKPRKPGQSTRAATASAA